MSRYDRPSHQVYMYFFKRGGWEVQFLEADLKDRAAPKADLYRSGEDQGIGAGRRSLGDI
jgi:hypothetical protein